RTALTLPANVQKAEKGQNKGSGVVPDRFPTARRWRPRSTSCRRRSAGSTSISTPFPSRRSWRETRRVSLDDLRTARKQLEELIEQLNVECREWFTQTFEAVRMHFQELFRKLKN